MKHASRMDKEWLINIQYSLHNAKYGCMVLAGEGGRKNSHFPQLENI